MKRILVILGALALVVFLFSCQTAPEAAPEEEAPEPEPTEEEAEPLPDELRVRAGELRDIIAQLDLGRFAETEYAAGEEAFASGENAYGDDNDLAEEHYQEAIEQYQIVLREGIGELQTQWEGEIEELNAQAQELKAPTAVPDDYEQARSTLEDARGAVEDERYDLAAGFYPEALEEHESVVNRTQEKRQAALDALDEIDSSIQSTEGDIEDLEDQQRTFNPAAEDLIEEEGQS
jgi:uncharacterized protein YukE